MDCRKIAIKHEAECGDMAAVAEMLSIFVSCAKSGELQKNPESLMFVVNACNKILNGETPNKAFNWTGKHNKVDQEWIVDIYLFHKAWAESKLAELDGQLAKATTRREKERLKKEKTALFSDRNPRMDAINKAADVSGLSADRVERIINLYHLKWRARQKYIDDLVASISILAP